MEVVLDSRIRLPDATEIEPPVCEICRNSNIICIRHPTHPLGHDGCEGSGMMCPRCVIHRRDAHVSPVR